MRPIYVLSLILVLFVYACGDSEPVNDPDPDPGPDPSAANLIFPDNNTECNEGTVINENQSSVTFRWSNAENTDSYDVTVRNLNTNATSVTSATTNQADITIERGTPYEWFVTSRANGTNATANSATWRFYNQGPGIENYAPFPATAINPERGAALSVGGTIALEWEGSDVDNDITGYEVLFGTDPEPVVSLGTTTDNTLDAETSAGQVYYWQVITNDSAGNSSESEIFEFQVL